METFLNQMAILSGVLIIVGLARTYWHFYIHPDFETKLCDLQEYARRKSSGRYFTYGILALMFLYIVFVSADSEAVKSVEGQAAFFFMVIVSLCLNLLGVGGGLRYLKEKKVDVTAFGKVVLVLEDAIYVVGMIAYYYLSMRESVLRT